MATQTIEVGADIDLDGMVTESAALPALIQRLGRVNRRGDRDGAPVIIAHSAALDDRVYGDARLRTWEWLDGLPGAAQLNPRKSGTFLEGGIDASPAELRRLLDRVPASDLAAMRGTRPYAPQVWAGPWTHGRGPRPFPIPMSRSPRTCTGSARANHSLPRLAGRGPGDDPRDWARDVELLPPSADEALELPVSIIRRWLASLHGA